MTQLLTSLAGATAQGIYVHVPVCRRRCSYCDFHSGPLDKAPAVVDAIIAELDLWAARLDLPAGCTAYIGGGTPTALPAGELERIVAKVRSVTPGIAEFTVEANPATLDIERAGRLRSLGVDRLSIGAQSFDQAELELLGRLHGADAVGRSVEIARQAGFDNVSLDLIYGLPGQSPANWRASVERAVALGVEHLSCYGLSIEPGTPLGEQLAAGRLAPQTDEAAVAMYRAAQAMLAEAGFIHYEISNWAKPGRESAHNLLYWRRQPVLGVGPSAASFLGGWRFRVAADNDRYVSAMSDGPMPPLESAEKLDGPRAVGEAAMLELRLRQGIDCPAFAARYGIDPLTCWGESVNKYRELGLLDFDGRFLALTDAALPVADSVLAEFI